MSSVAHTPAITSNVRNVARLKERVSYREMSMKICKLIGHDFSFHWKEFIFCLRCAKKINLEKSNIY